MNRLGLFVLLLFTSVAVNASSISPARIYSVDVETSVYSIAEKVRFKATMTQSEPYLLEALSIWINGSPVYIPDFSYSDIVKPMLNQFDVGYSGGFCINDNCTDDVGYIEIPFGDYVGEGCAYSVLGIEFNESEVTQVSAELCFEDGSAEYKYYFDREI